MKKSNREAAAFTLVELLVVIAIIALLIAILLPALAKAKYRARVVQCLANQKMLGIAVITYSGDNRTWYPYRTVGMNGLMPTMIQDRLYATETDDRPMFKKFMNIDTQLTCPFAPLSPGRSYNDTVGASGQVNANYELWFGTRVALSQQGSSMHRAGDRPRYTSAGVTYQFNVLAADLDRDWNGAGIYNVLTSHPDDRDSLPRYEVYDATYIISIYRRAFGSAATRTRGAIDRNFLYDDGSARTRKTSFRDPALVPVPAYPDQMPATAGAQLFLPPMD